MKCPQCNNDHDLLEPVFRRPDEIFALSAAERAERVNEDDDMCRLRMSDPGEAVPAYRYFLRTVLRVPLLDVDDVTQWGLWVELSERDIHRVRELWSDPDQGSEPPFHATVANRVPGYPDTIGLPVSARLRNPPLRAEATFSAGVEHAFAAECRRGVTIHRVHEWLRSMGIDC